MGIFILIIIQCISNDYWCYLFEYSISHLWNGGYWFYLIRYFTCTDSNRQPALIPIAIKFVCRFIHQPRCKAITETNNILYYQQGAPLVQQWWLGWPTNRSCNWTPFNSSPPSVAYLCQWGSIGSDNGLSPDRHQAIIWTNTGILLLRPLETNFSESILKIQKFSFMKMHLKMLSAKWLPFCPGGDELNPVNLYLEHISFIHSLSQWVPGQATGHYLSQCWPRPMSPYGITRPQCVNDEAMLTEI